MKLFQLSQLCIPTICNGLTVLLANSRPLPDGSRSCTEICLSNDNLTIILCVEQVQLNDNEFYLLDSETHSDPDYGQFFSIIGYTVAQRYTHNARFNSRFGETHLEQYLDFDGINQITICNEIGPIPNTSMRISDSKGKDLLYCALHAHGILRVKSNS